MIKKILLILVIVVLAVVGLVLSSNLWLKYALATGIQTVTGFPTKVKSTNLDLAGSKFGLYGLEIENPSGFPKSRFVSIPEVFVDFDLSEFLSHKRLYIQEIRLNLEEMSIVKNRLGETNISRLTAVNKTETQAQKPKPSEKTTSPEQVKFFVERLVLTLGSARYIDETTPLIGEKKIDLHVNQEVVQNISSPLDIIRLIVLKVIYKAALGNLGVPVDLLKGQLDTSLARGQELAEQGTKLAQQMGTEALGKGTKMVGQVTEQFPVSATTAHEAVNQVEQKTKGLLGGATGFLKNKIQTVEEKAKSATSSN